MAISSKPTSEISSNRTSGQLRTHVRAAVVQQTTVQLRKLAKIESPYRRSLCMHAQT
jgi:hypothetical protein